MQGVSERIDDHLKLEGITGRGTGEASVTRSAWCDATPEVNRPVGVRGRCRVEGTSLTGRTNQVSVICHLSSSCRDKPNLPKFFSSNWETSWLMPRANAFCWVPPSTHHAALPKQPTRFPAPRGHRLSSRFEPPALPMKFLFPPPYVIFVALVYCHVSPPSSAHCTTHHASQASGSQPATSRMQANGGSGLAFC